ncbi:MAG: sensor histidine kinase [Eubacterium sp.]
MINSNAKKIIFSGVALTFISTAICLFIKPVCAIVCLVGGGLQVFLFYLFTLKRYKEINELNNYLSVVCTGNFDLDIDSNAEGELSILKNNLYKVIVLLRSQNELLTKERRYLSDSLADISHQLKTPLTSMMVMTDLIKEDVSRDKQKEFVSIIENQLDKMKWLITNLLKLSKLDADTADFKIVNISAKDVISDSIKPFLVMMDLKGITLNNLSDDFIFKGDKNWTDEAVSNVIKNCIEHTEKGGEITVSTESTNIYNSIFIKDNGCGISKEDLPHIFERFYHGKNSSSDSVGIGLALAKTVMEKEKGTILIKSQENIGTEFEMRFYKYIV